MYTIIQKHKITGTTMSETKTDSPVIAQVVQDAYLSMTKEPTTVYVLSEEDNGDHSD